MNWSNTQFVPTVGGVDQAAQAITGVTDVRLDPRGSVVTFSGDADALPTLKAHDMTDPQVTVTCSDLAALQALPPGTRGTFSAKHLDAKNQGTTGGGGYSLEVDNAIVVNTPIGGAHRQIGQGTLTIECESTDGSTSPLVYTAL